MGCRFQFGSCEITVRIIGNDTRGCNAAHPNTPSQIESTITRAMISNLGDTLHHTKSFYKIFTKLLQLFYNFPRSIC